MSSTRVLSLYRQLVRAAREVPGEKGKQALEDISREFRENADLTDIAKIEELVKRGEGSLGFLRMIRRKVNPSGSDSGSWQVHNGSVVQVDSNASRGSTSRVLKGHHLDPADFKRHQRLVERQHFGRPKNYKDFY